MIIRIIKILIYSLVFAAIVYGVYILYQEKNTPLSPIPEDGIKVIQVVPQS